MKLVLLVRSLIKVLETYGNVDVGIKADGDKRYAFYFTVAPKISEGRPYVTITTCDLAKDRR